MPAPGSSRMTSARRMANSAAHPEESAVANTSLRPFSTSVVVLVRGVNAAGYLGVVLLLGFLLDRTEARPCFLEVLVGVWPRGGAGGSCGGSDPGRSSCPKYFRCKDRRKSVSS